MTKGSVSNIRITSISMLFIMDIDNYYMLGRVYKLVLTKLLIKTY